MTPNECVFIYNHVQTRNPSAIQAAVGLGIACVCLFVVNRDHQVVLSLPPSSSPKLSGEEIQRMSDSLFNGPGMEFPVSSGLFALFLSSFFPAVLNGAILA